MPNILCKRVLLTINFIIFFKSVVNRIFKTIFKVCVSGLYVNEKQIFVGENDDLPEFSFGHDELVCNAEQMKTSLINIQNEEVIISQCDTSTWTRNNDNDDDSSESCWDACGRKGGKCHNCDIDGNEGFCCKKDFMSHNGNCPDQAIMASSSSGHTCVHGKFSDSLRQGNEIGFRAKDVYSYYIK